MKKIILFFLIGIFIFIDLTLVSAATFTNVVNNCVAEDSAIKGSFF